MPIKTKGTVLAYGNTADHATAATWTPLARCRSIKPPARSCDKIDTTVLVSTDKEGLPGLPESGDLEATIEYDKTLTTTLEAMVGVLTAWRVVYNDTSGRKWNGWISEIGEEEVVNGDIVKQTIKIAITGAIVPFATST